jgi:flagellar hook-associated protein 3 FlgL
MRVTNQTVYRHTAANIEQSAARLLEMQRQVGTNKRVERGSHDPAAASAAAVERGHLAATDAYSAASDSAKSRLTVTDTVLSDLIQQLTAAQVTVVAARGSTMTDAQREARAQELTALRDAMLQDLNTSFRGTYLFSGAASTTAPYTKNGMGVVSAYQGAALEVSVDIDNALEAPVAFNGDALARGSEVDDLFVVMERAIDAVRNADGAELDQAAAELERAFERTTTLQGRVGASLRAIDDGQLRLDESARASTARLSALEDANMAAAISGMTQAETVYRAALGAASQTQRVSLMDYLR